MTGAKRRYRIVPISRLSTAAYEVQQRFGWKYFGFWDRMHIEWMDPKNPSEAYELCLSVKEQLEKTDSK